MKPYINVKFSDGRIVEIPTSVIAEDRANYYHENRPEEFPTFDDALKDSTELFASDTYEIEDWAKNNMQWEELEPHARIIGFEPVDNSWQDAEVTFSDGPAEIAPAQDDENLINMPLLYAIARIGAAGGFCNMINLSGTDGVPVAAVAFIQGGSEAVGYYTNGLRRLTQLAEEMQAGQPEATDASAQH